MNGITFAYPYLLWLLCVIPVLGYWYFFHDRKTHPQLHVSSLGYLPKIKRTWRQRFYPVSDILRLATITLLIIALARPQSSNKIINENIEGIDIVLAMDISGSMLAADFKPDRLEAAKKVAKDFISARKTDRMAIVGFSGEAYTHCPLTTDQRMLLSQLRSLKSGVIEDGTAIGDGLAISLNRVKNSNAKSKVIILLTDGVNNMGATDPRSIAEIAKNYDIKVYTIGVGKKGLAPYPFQTPFGIQYQNIEVPIDEELLQDIAFTTHGKYFRATNQKALASIFKEIDALEKTKIEVLSYETQSEEYKVFLVGALVLFLLELVSRLFVFKTLP